jgi:hypothetical protein
LPALILPEREMLPPAFRAAASAWAMKGLVLCAPDDRMRPGRTLNSRSSAMAALGNVRKVSQIQHLGLSAHIAEDQANVRKAPENPKETTDQPRRNVRLFI